MLFGPKRCLQRVVRAAFALVLNVMLVLVESEIVAGSPVNSSNLPPDIIVAADGSGNFRTIQEAVASVPKGNRERMVVLIKIGTYEEKIRVDAPFVTLRGQSRKETQIKFRQGEDDFAKSPDEIGGAVINLSNTANDFVLENLHIENTAGGGHAFAILGHADRTVILDCDAVSRGTDTVALWPAVGGQYYHARSYFRGALDILCPRGWCYVTDCAFYETRKSSATLWHHGRSDRDMKFVLRNCTFDGAEGFLLARHHVDAQFYFLDAHFSKAMADEAPARVIYKGDPKKNAEFDKDNLWGERTYFHNCHRESGDYGWHRDNLSSAPGSPTPEQITARWSLGGGWNPERSDEPAIQRIDAREGQIEIVFNENVTVKGKPRLILKPNGFATYACGSGTNTLMFTALSGEGWQATAIDLQGGAIIASEARATLRSANLALP
jgi:pectinesterase